MKERIQILHEDDKNKFCRKDFCAKSLVSIFFKFNATPKNRSKVENFQTKTVKENGFKFNKNLRKVPIPCKVYSDAESTHERQNENEDEITRAKHWKLAVSFVFIRIRVS